MLFIPFCAKMVKKMVYNMDQQYHPSQTSSFNELVIQIDDNDKNIGYITKKESHLLCNIRKHNIYHRAFSVFMFNQNNELLLQQRAETKITFKKMWTNSCCSHPNYGPYESEELNNNGVKRAAQRRVNQELNYQILDKSKMKVIQRIQYQAESDETWGESESKPS